MWLDWFVMALVLVSMAGLLFFVVSKVLEFIFSAIKMTPVIYRPYMEVYECLARRWRRLIMGPNRRRS